MRDSGLVQTLKATKDLESGFLHPDGFAGCERDEATSIFWAAREDIHTVCALWLKRWSAAYCNSMMVLPS
jgi:hypothetical protein